MGLAGVFLIIFGQQWTTVYSTGKVNPASRLTLGTGQDRAILLSVWSLLKYHSIRK